MKASKLRPHLGYHLLGCQCMIKKCHQMVQAKAIRATQLDHTLSKADTSAGQGDCCPMYFVNSWALGWSSDCGELELWPGPALGHMCWPGTWPEIIAIIEPQSWLTTRSVASFFPDFLQIQKKRRPSQRLFQGSCPRLATVSDFLKFVQRLKTLSLIRQQKHWQPVRHCLSFHVFAQHWADLFLTDIFSRADVAAEFIQA